MSESEQNPAADSTETTETIATPTPVTDAAPTTAAPSDSPSSMSAFRRNPGPLVAALAVGALVGGGAGAGVAAWVVSAGLSSQEQIVTTPQTITVNDPDGVNIVNAVAAKAAPSVVTIAARSNTAGGTGSGVILSSDGYVLTNNHVITLGGASSDATIQVTTSDGRIFAAEVVGTDPTVDLAVIKLLDASGLQPIEFGDSSQLDVGDRVIAIGAPLGLANTVTDGIVSALNRSIDIESSAVPDSQDDGSSDDDGFFNFQIPGQNGSGARISIPVIQTDAAINPGNSGGALVDDEGRLVGINVAIATAGGSGSGSIGVGFAIPVDLAERVANELIANGVATHGLLGATVRNANSGDGGVVGALVVELTPGGAAEAAGLRLGDIVTAFDGHPITNRVDLTAQVRALAAGSIADLTYLRDGTSNTVTVTLDALE
jgi:putative serine protease PepD